MLYINFRLIDGAKLIYSAKQDAEHIKIYRTNGSKELCEYFDRLEKDITIMSDVGAKGQCYVSHPADILTDGIKEKLISNME